jgi:hypothetical protein
MRQVCHAAIASSKGISQTAAVIEARRRGERTRATTDDVKNLSQIWAVAPALVKLALRDDRRSQIDKEPPWKRIAKGLI